METEAVLPLIPEILYLICGELGKGREYDTLYQCALTSRALADAALRTIYQYHELSPAFIQSDEDNIKSNTVSYQQKWKEAERSFRKWTILWRSIIASSLDGTYTYKPYCRYLRVLDFRNLAQMLEDPKFVKSQRDFFKKELQRFSFPQQYGRIKAINLGATVNAVGEAVIPKTFQLEEVSGDLTSEFLTSGITHTPRLKSLVLFNGDALTAKTGAAIAASCEGFDTLTIREWKTEHADEAFEGFLNNLKGNTLQYFEMISFNRLGQLSFQGLSNHKNLQELKLGSLSDVAMRNLDALRGCTELHTLVLEDQLGSTSLEALRNDVFLDVIQWLSSCSKLKDITIKRFVDGAAILAQVVSSPSVKLMKLSLEGYTLVRQSSAAFHTALAEQSSLESLSLKGNGEDASPEDLTVMVEALSHLTNLQELILKDISDEFEEEHIITLALHLPNLEEFWTSGNEFSEDVLVVLRQLKSLKNLTLLAETKFTAFGILDFIQKLDKEKQKHFSLSLMAQHSGYHLSEEEQGLILSEIDQLLEGRFEYAAWREAESSEDDSD